MLANLNENEEFKLNPSNPTLEEEEKQEDKSEYIQELENMVK